MTDIFDDILNPQEEPTSDFADTLAEDRDKIDRFLDPEAWRKQAEEVREEPEEPKPERKKNSLPPKSEQKNWLTDKIDTPKDFMKVKKKGRPFGSKNKTKQAQKKAIQESVQVMKACGLSKATIANVLGVKPASLATYFGHELEYGEEILKTRIASILVKKALDGNVPAITFFLKAKAGWRDQDKEKPQDDENKTISDVERNQRLVSLLMSSPQLIAAMKKKRAADAPPIEILPKGKETVDKSFDSSDDVFD